MARGIGAGDVTGAAMRAPPWWNTSGPAVGLPLPAVTTAFR